MGVKQADGPSEEPIEPQSPPLMPRRRRRCGNIVAAAAAAAADRAVAVAA